MFGILNVVATPPAARFAKPLSLEGKTQGRGNYSDELIIHR
jgi:hypothetical protein